MTLDDVLRSLGALPEDKRQEVAAAAKAATAHMKWLPSPGPQLDAYFHPADVLLYGGQGGGGKGQPMDGLVLTPFGYRKMAEIKVGSKVCAPDGTVSEVIGVYPLGVRQLYRVAFHDGTSVEVTDDHIWLAWRSNKNRKIASVRVGSEAGARLWTTAQLRSLVHKERFRVPVTAPVIFNDQARYPRRPVDPYTMGALLGDGSLTAAALRLTTADAEIADRVAAGVGMPLFGPYAYSGRAPEYRIPKEAGYDQHFTKWGLLGADSANKFIPAAYLLGTIPERWALLQGLMDTDGWADADGDVYFTTVSRRLAEGVAELARSLGAIVTWREKIPTFTAASGEKKAGQRAITLRLKFADGSLAFGLGRKKARVTRRPQSMGKVIVSIEPTRMAEAQCIKVSHPSSLYIADGFTVTHNTDLGLGLAFTAHRRSLILRRKYTNLGSMIERAIEIHGSRTGFNGSPPPLLRTADGRYIQFAGNQHLGDEQDWQGQPFDFKHFDEATQFQEEQIRFHLGWLRSTTPGQRVRALLATNPPVDAQGDWIIGMFRPWLDLTHPKPAAHGEVRWFVTDPEGKDMEVDGPEPVQFHGRKEPAIPTSRSFIPAALKDNPYLVNTNYQAQLDGLPEPIRSAVRDGNFMAARADADFQIIPTTWVIEAQNRWSAQPPANTAMTAMGFDPAGGGKDAAALAYRYGGWYGPIVTKQGEETADGSRMAALVLVHRRDACPVVCDMGGGFGGAITQRFKDNGVAFIGFNGGQKSTAQTVGAAKLGFYNKRAEAWWRFREALDPDQQGGSSVALPPDPELRAELTAPTFELKPTGILVESKDDIRDRIGRSTNKADAVIMALSEGATAVKRAAVRNAGLPATANLGHMAAKRFYGRR